MFAFNQLPVFTLQLSGIEIHVQLLRIVARVHAQYMHPGNNISTDSAYPRELAPREQGRKHARKLIKHLVD